LARIIHDIESDFDEILDFVEWFGDESELLDLQCRSRRESRLYMLGELSGLGTATTFVENIIEQADIRCLECGQEIEDVRDGITHSDKTEYDTESFLFYCDQCAHF